MGRLPIRIAAERPAACEEEMGGDGFVAQTERRAPTLAAARSFGDGEASARPYEAAAPRTGWKTCPTKLVEHRQDVVFRHDQELLAVDVDLVAGVGGEED